MSTPTPTQASLVEYGNKIARAGLVVGAGGNISARDGATIWMKPSGLAMDDITPADLCGLDLATGEQKSGPHKPTSEYAMHLGIYRNRPEVNAVFHVHSPWSSGIFSSGAELKPMFAEFVNDLGRVATIPYILPTSKMLADAVSDAFKNCDTLFMENHGMIGAGVNMKQAYYRCLIVEDAAKSMIAAAVVGTPRFLTPEQQTELLSLGAVQHRINMMKNQK
ncbi:MAG: class II aldolase/adducin family protein [Kiritimatiellaeota bacterium]|nr:class II aldolase/adducin family protein [Kiritimatiellota bacterium]